MSGCIDLEVRFPMHQIGYEDPSQEATRDPWHKVIRCKGGCVSPYGGELLLACTNNSWNGKRFRLSKWTKAVAALDCVEVVQDGDDGINATFNVSDARIVFEAIGAIER